MMVDRTPRHRWALTGDRGWLGGAEILPFGLLVFLVGVLLTVNAWAVIDAKLAIDSASQAASRSISEADHLDSAQLELLVDRAIADLGLDSDRVHVELDRRGTSLTRCERVTVTVTYEVPALSIPIVGGFGDGVTVQSSASELVDPFRSSTGLVAAESGPPCG